MSFINTYFGSDSEMAIVMGMVIFLVSVVTGVIVTPLMCRLSIRWGAVDKPDGKLKCHHRATPTLGGVPMIVSVVVSMGIVYLLRSSSPFRFEQWYGNNLSWVGLSIGVVIILLLGIKDDLHHVMPRTKLLYQVIASMILIGSGLVVQRCNMFNVAEFNLGVFAVPFTLFWLVGSCNAFNFIDGMDGLASGIGTVVGLVLAVLGYLTGHYGEAIIALAMAGGVMAILFYNIKPAKIFLGDSGSQVIGFVYGILTIKIATQNGAFILPSAGLIISLPVVDAFLSILRRYSREESAACGDREHIHHCLRRHGLTINQVAVSLWMATMVFGMMGVLFHFTTGVVAGAGALCVVVIEVYLGVRFGCLDVVDFWERIRGVRPIYETANTISNVKKMAELEILWDRMKPFFEKMKLDRAVLTLEGVNADGQPDYETYQWVRSEEQLADLLASQWTKRFPLDPEQQRFATLRLESTEKLRRDEERIDWLLKQIRENMHFVNQQRDKVEELNAVS